MRRALGILLLLAPAGGEDHAEAIARFRAFTRERLAADGTPGLTIGFRKGAFTWVEGFGFADLENRVPAKAESAYRLASVTKPMTAAAILALAEEGKIDLDAEARAYVPYFPEKPHPVTVRQLLGHLGGISHYRDYAVEGHFKEHKDTREAIAVFAAFDLVAEPGTRYFYSSYGYNLLGAVLEEASGKAYADLMREKVWGPLGMDATRMDDPTDLIPNRVRGYRRGPDGRIAHSEFVDISSRFAAGGTRSTVPDMLAFADVLRSGKVLSAAGVERMLESMATRAGRWTDYGMGWGIGAVNGRLVASHSGGQAETATLLLCLPDDDFAIAAAMNLEGGDRGPYVARLYEEVMGEPYPGRYYLSDPAERRLFDAVNSAFENGVSRFRRPGGPPAIPEAEAAAAFAYFDGIVEAALVEKDLEKAAAKIRDGRHPLAGEALPRMGIDMAAKLAASEGGIEGLHRGPILFFHRYAALSRREGTIPGVHRFQGAFEEALERWATDWGRTVDATRLALEISPSTDFARLGEHSAKHFPERFAAASIVPDLWPRFADVVELLLRNGDDARAAEATALAVSLYPARDDPRFYEGVARLALGDVESGRAAIRRALEIDPGGAAAAEALNRTAYALRSGGRAEIGLALLRIGVELHPGVANLHDSVGEFLAAAGEREAAIAAYRKALEVDPALASARSALERLTGQ